MNKISEKMYEALTLRYRSEMAESEATLLIYFNNSVGIGEHPQHLEEMDKFVEKMTNAKDKLDMLETVYTYNVKREDNFKLNEEILKLIKNNQGDTNGN